MLKCTLKAKDGFEIRKMTCPSCGQPGIRRIVRPTYGVVDRPVCSSCGVVTNLDFLNVFDFTEKSEVARLAYHNNIIKRGE